MNNVWLSEVFRLTAFFQGPDASDPSSWWKQVTGEEPTNKIVQPKNKLFQDEGPYAGGHLVLTKQPGRIDWLFIPSFDNQLGMADFRDLKPFDEKREIFEGIANRWLEACPTFSRLAFGAILNMPVESGSKGYSELSNFLTSVDIDAEDSSDLIYQINRRRMSKIIPGLTINRLSKWSVAIVDVGYIPTGTPFEEGAIKETLSFARLELDINTFQGYKDILPREKYTSIFNELMDLAYEIKEKGDVK